MEKMGCCKKVEGLCRCSMGDRLYADAGERVWKGGEEAD